jgi:hypothetical protein
MYSVQTDFNVSKLFYSSSLTMGQNELECLLCLQVWLQPMSVEYLQWCLLYGENRSKMGGLKHNILFFKTH